MDGETSTLASILAWLPFIILMAAVWYFARAQNQKYAEHVRTVNDVNDKILAANEKMVVALEDIKAALEKNNK